jgi:hypothetical protein
MKDIDMKNIIMIFLALVFTTNFINAVNVNSTSTEARKMFKLCPSSHKIPFKRYKNDFLKEEKFKNYKNIFLAENKDFFYYLLKNDFNGDSLRCISQKLLDNKEIMLDAVTINSKVFQYASEHLKKDRDVVLRALKTLPYNIKYVDKSLLNDKEIVLLGLKNNGMFLQYVDEKLKNDKDVVREAFRERTNSLQYASDALKNDKEYMLELAKINHYAYDYIGDSLKKNKELAMIGLVWNKDRLKDMNMIFRDDPKIILAAIKQNIKYLQDASNRLRSDKEFVFGIINHNAEAIKYTTQEFKNNKKIMLEAIKKNPDSYRWIDENLKEDLDICLATVKNRGYLLSYLSKKCRQNKKIVKVAVTNDPNALMYADKILRNDKEIVTIAIKSKGYTLHYASPSLKKDKTLIELALKSNHPYKKNPIKHTVYPDAWDSSTFDDTLELLYGEDANFTQTDKIKVSDGIKIQTDLKLKSIAILRRRLIAWYPVVDANAVSISISVADGRYKIIGEGIDGKLYMSSYHSTREEEDMTCMPLADLHEKYKFYDAHLKRKVAYSGNIAHMEFMIVNDTPKRDKMDELDFNAIMRRTKKVDFYVTKVRIEAGGKTVYTIYLNRLINQNPYFTVDFPAISKDQNITIYCTDTKHPKEYIWKDKIEFSKKYQYKSY